MEVKFFGRFVYVKTTAGMLVRMPAETGEKFSVEGAIDISPDEEEEGPPAAHVGPQQKEARFPDVDGPQRFERDYGVPRGRVGIYGWITRKPGAE